MRAHTFPSRCQLAQVALLSISASVLSACGGSDGSSALASDQAADPTTSQAAAAHGPPLWNRTPADACTALNGTVIDASAISFPTTGAVITSTALQAPSGTGASAVGEYCKVLGAIKPVDPAAPNINFQVNLPSTWNGKAIQMMGGGYDGNVVSGLGPVVGSAGFSSPLGRGYVTFGSDSGHSGSAVEASFALNEEALNNYLGDQLRKTRDVAVALMTSRYKDSLTKTYSAGGSGGGREALYVADRWPTLYDGVISFFPAWSLTAMLTNYNRIAKALAAPGAWSNTTKQALVRDSVIAACDSLDGVADGVVSNVAACHFDPQTLRCPGGADTGNTCLSDAQIAGFTSYTTGLKLSFLLANGTNSYPGYNIFDGAVNLVGAMGSIAPATPSNTNMAFAHYIGESYVRFWITGDADYDSLQFAPDLYAYFIQRAQYISTRQDITPDLTNFLSKGGKVLIVHGMADQLIPANSSREFYNRTTAAMGAQSVQSFLRYYEVPGYGHGNGAFTVSWDSLTVLENWVEKGIAPGAQTVRDTNASQNNRTRPLCEYGTWPKYNGTGDVNSAASFTCVPTN